MNLLQLIDWYKSVVRKSAKETRSKRNTKKNEWTFSNTPPTNQPKSKVKLSNTIPNIVNKTVDLSNPKRKTNTQVNKNNNRNNYDFTKSVLTKIDNKDNYFTNRVVNDIRKTKRTIQKTNSTNNKTKSNILPEVIVTGNKNKSNTTQNSTQTRNTINNYTTKRRQIRKPSLLDTAKKKISIPTEHTDEFDAELKNFGIISDMSQIDKNAFKIVPYPEQPGIPNSKLKQLDFWIFPESESEKKRKTKNK